MRSWLAAAFFVLACELAGVLGALATQTGTSAWYQELAKPWFQPPPWVFGPVWTLLYALMGIAAWRVWRGGMEKPGVRWALGLFALQLGLNAAWSPVFFGAHEIGFALAILAALWLVLAATIRAFALLDRAAAWLLAPYLAWVTFALVLNAAILHLNP